MKAVTTHNFCTNVSFACDVNQMSGKKKSSAECLDLSHRHDNARKIGEILLFHRFRRHKVCQVNLHMFVLN